jgi:hypothetical protein
MSILGFNLGIEVMQAAVVLLVLPWLLLWSRGARFTLLRVGGAAVGGAAACGWVLERALGVSTPLGPWAEAASRHGWVGLAVLAAMALGMPRRRRRGPADGALT